MKSPFWRCVIVSLLLWALPAQWLAMAASKPCIGHAAALVDAAVLFAAEHEHAHDQAHVHSTVDVANPDSEAGPVTKDPAVVHTHTPCQCATVGHCCLSAALLPAALPDFARRGTSTQFAPLAQPHPTPLLSGPDRPPQTQLA